MFIYLMAASFSVADVKEANFIPIPSHADLPVDQPPTAAGFK